MPIKKKTLHIEKYNKDNQEELNQTLYENVYFTDIRNFSFEMFPTATIFLLRGDLWFFKNLILGFCVVLDFKNIPTISKQIYAEACQLDYKKIDSYNGVLLQELGVMPRYRNKGLGSKLFKYVKDNYTNREIILKAENTALEFWRKMNFVMIEGTQKNNMIFKANPEWE